MPELRKSIYQYNYLPITSQSNKEKNTKLLLKFHIASLLKVWRMENFLYTYGWIDSGEKRL